MTNYSKLITTAFLFGKLSRWLAMALVVCSLMTVIAYLGHVDQDASASVVGRVQTAVPRTDVLAEGAVLTYPGENVVVSAEYAAKVLRVLKTENASVRSGETIIELDSTIERADFAVAEAAFRESESNLRLAELEASRSEVLFQKGFLSKEGHDRAKLAAEVALARAGKSAAEVNKRRQVISRYVIKSPIGGTITKTFIAGGEAIIPGTKLLEIANLKKLRIIAEVGEFDAPYIRRGAGVSISAEGYPGYSWPGSVEEVPDVVAYSQIRPRDPSRPADIRVASVTIGFKQDVPLRLGQRVQVRIAATELNAP